MHLTVKFSLLVLTVFLINQVDSTQCPNCDCECSEKLTKVICTDVGRSIPNCIPEKTVTELRIQESPKFSKIGRNDLQKFKKLQKLSIIATGLETIHWRALKDLENFEVIEIVSSSSLKSFSRGTFNGMSKLRNITVRGCKSFDKLQNKIFGSLTGLEVLSLKDNNLTDIEEDILDQTTNVTLIDLSDNGQLVVLPRNVFAHLDKLSELNLRNCSLEVLYPEHVKTPQESGSLTSFDGTLNNWQCNKMCEFFKWLETDYSFRNRYMNTMGWCGDLIGSTCNKWLSSVHPEDVCPYPGNIVMQVLVGVLFSSILALTCCFLWVTCATKYCRCFKRSSSNDTSTRTSRSSNSVVPTREHGNQAYVEADETPQFSTEDMLQADCNVGDWNINSVDPPLYDVVVGNGGDDRDKENYDNSDSDSDIAPPPYDDTVSV